MNTSLDAYNASIVPTEERPYVYIREGQRYAFTEKQHQFYVRQLGRKLVKLYTIETYKA